MCGNQLCGTKEAELYIAQITRCDSLQHAVGGQAVAGATDWS